MTCSVDGGAAVSSPNSCSLTDLYGGSATAAVGESYNFASGILQYVASGNFRTTVDMSGPLGQEGSRATLAINSTLDFSTSGPVRQGYLRITSPSFNGQGIDSGITFSGTTSFSVPNIYTATCPTNATNQCFIPSILLPITLGSTIPFTFTTSNTGSTTAGVVPEGSSLLLDARFNLQLFEADRVTPAAITSASPIPEPSTYGMLMLAGGMLSGLAYRNKRRA